ncbi:hypothetical protein SAY87_015248 [Trapa incisa]|uniref:Uncharacterized protein n=1 Tax=Trapa incisa TaxID=236973 RepID=A0AAN7H3K0_9MYRT|nr:hypothetical protein SAY87_015248 [Trapa incisa]
MGNCLETYSNQSWVRREEIRNSNSVRELEDCSGERGDSSGIKGRAAMRVKVVLTREELEWLMLQLRDSKGGSVGSRKRSLEEILGEIERGRSSKSSSSPSRTAAAAAAAVWRPSLDSITEIPEVLDHMGRS